MTCGGGGVAAWTHSPLSTLQGAAVELFFWLVGYDPTGLFSTIFSFFF